ncbi:MAG: glycerophosphodiester phosphodiesterase family protein [Aliarcobacter sp.]|nr:glycerophosphodiester phosphodiesterase family protein [Aliarcobacter sp.]
MNLFKNRFIAHRGLHKSRVIPENSILAFNSAIEKNYAIEFDINITKDNQIVVFHDDDLNRLCNKKEKIEDVTYTFLKDLKLYESDEKIPLLKELLDEVNGKIPLVIEIKKHENIGVLENILIEMLKEYKGEYFICSFEKDILFWFRNNKPKQKRGLIFASFPNKFKKYEKAVFIYKFFKTKADFISLENKLINSLIYDFCKKKNLEVIVWTIKDKKSFKNIDKKVSAVIFESFII